MKGAADRGAAREFLFLPAPRSGYFAAAAAHR